MNFSPALDSLLLWRIYLLRFYWNLVWILLESLLDSIGISFGFFWNLFWIILESLLDSIGISLLIDMSGIFGNYSHLLIFDIRKAGV